MFTDRLARWIWMRILMGSRRNRSRRHVAKLFAVIPEPHRSRLRRKISRQERFARRHAVPLLKFTLNLAWCSLFLSLVLIVSTYIQESGWLRSPFER